MRTLYGYFRSSAEYRLRIALNLKKLDYERVSVHLLRNGGEQRATEYAQLNPLKLVPTLVENNSTLVQSLAILEYLEEVHPKPALLPAEPRDRARVRALALTVACEIHPLNNLGVLQFLKEPLKLDENAIKQTWYHHWIHRGFSGIEALLQDTRTGTFCHGDNPTIADVCLVPQVYNARRFNCDLTPYPTIVRIEQHCLTLDAFAQAVPERQSDCPKSD